MIPQKGDRSQTRFQVLQSQLQRGGCVLVIQSYS